MEKQRKGSGSSCLELLKAFRREEVFPEAEKLLFFGVEKRDVYNISKPFFIDGEIIIAGRVEERADNANSQIIFFKKEKDGWYPICDAPVFPLEDGCVVKIGSEIILSGIEVYPSPTTKNPRNVEYRTVFYRGRDLFSLKRFAVGPKLMKDIRLVELSNGHIGVFTRPQGGEYGKGKIGFIELDSLRDINPKNLLKAEIIPNQFFPGEWGGVNDAHVFKNWVYVIGHIAYEDEQGGKHYYAMSFVYKINSHCASAIKIIATSKNFPAGEAKSPKHEDIVFPSGFNCNYNGTITLYVGIRDSESYKVVLPCEEFDLTKRPIFYIFNK